MLPGMTPGQRKSSPTKASEQSHRAGRSWMFVEELLDLNTSETCIGHAERGTRTNMTWLHRSNNVVNQSLRHCSSCLSACHPNMDDNIQVAYNELNAYLELSFSEGLRMPENIISLHDMRRLDSRHDIAFQPSSLDFNTGSSSENWARGYSR